MPTSHLEHVSHPARPNMHRVGVLDHLAQPPRIDPAIGERGAGDQRRGVFGQITIRPHRASQFLRLDAPQSTRLYLHGGAKQQPARGDDDSLAAAGAGIGGIDGLLGDTMRGRQDRPGLLGTRVLEHFSVITQPYSAAHRPQ
ncbi:hypothetical protein DE4576_05339 [Mycobacterium marinum]|uniref:Uncharacterized protein n=2 Tax=Mycobacterium marinum TaxID=1781 RepID=A0A3E2MSI6_MYCMR|nr:hypothetical protein DAVIS_03836 [Mycobacterium marinum]RFZ62108.1 hypothetical protein DE4576_05339 [Mycobacterium marinum]